MEHTYITCRKRPILASTINVAKTLVSTKLLSSSFRNFVGKANVVPHFLHLMMMFFIVFYGTPNILATYLYRSLDLYFFFNETV